MSAGSGIVHSEANASATESLNLFQIWVFPKVENIQPRYDQRTFLAEDRKNKMQVVVSPDDKDQALWINQDAWFSLGDFDKGNTLEYKTHLTGNGAFIQVIEGTIEVDGEVLNTRDAIGISGDDTILCSFTSDAKILIIEVPMN